LCKKKKQKKREREREKESKNSFPFFEWISKIRDSLYVINHLPYYEIFEEGQDVDFFEIDQLFGREVHLHNKEFSYGIHQSVDQK